MRLGAITYLIPFFFVLNPAMIAQGGSPIEIVWVVITCILGITLVAGVFEGYMWGMGNIGWIVRSLGFVSGLLLAIPEAMTDICGGAILVVVIGIYLSRRRNLKISITGRRGVNLVI